MEKKYAKNRVTKAKSQLTKPRSVIRLVHHPINQVLHYWYTIMEEPCDET